MVQSRNLDPTDECDCHSDGPDLALQERPGPGFSELAFRSELRAVEQGHHVVDFTVVDHEFIAKAEVVSNCRHSLRHDVVIYLQPGQTLPASATCTCESGRYRSSTYPVPCKHAALVLRSLERRNRVTWNEGLWWAPGIYEARLARKKTIDIPTDPFEGLVEDEEEDL